MQKRLLVLMVMALATLAGAQEAPSQGGLERHATTEVLGAKTVMQGPTYEDVYCAGYITSQPPQIVGYVSGNWNSPDEATTGMHRYVYLTGSGFEVGKEYELIRHVKDSNHARTYKGQAAAVRAAGS